MSEKLIVNLLLIDGEATGVVQAKIGGWSGIAYRIPAKSMLSITRDELDYSGVYFLLGRDEETDEGIFYVGRASKRNDKTSVKSRFRTHQQDESKSFCSEVIFFTDANDEFGSTDIDYLEHKFYEIAVNARRYKKTNQKVPSKGNVTEEKQIVLDKYIKYAKILMVALGHKVLEEKRKPNAIKLFYSRTVNGKHIEAKADWTNEGIVVLAGSQVLMEDKLYLNHKLSEERKQLFNSGKLSPDSKRKGEKVCILKEDWLFGSPSRAASFVTGASENGRTSWHTKTGKTIAQLEEEEISSSTKSKNTSKK